jgi:hypothetical protein
VRSKMRPGSIRPSINLMEKLIQIGRHWGRSAGDDHILVKGRLLEIHWTIVQDADSGTGLKPRSHIAGPIWLRRPRRRPSSVPFLLTVLACQEGESIGGLGITGGNLAGGSDSGRRSLLFLAGDVGRSFQKCVRELITKDKTDEIHRFYH